MTQCPSLEDAKGALWDFALKPQNWVDWSRRAVSVAHFRRVETVQIGVSVDVAPTLDTYLRVSFRGPQLTPMQAADLLETFVKGRFTFTPNIEWEVEIDAHGWVHFTRPYTGTRLKA